jgi:hypothetical protein
VVFTGCRTKCSSGLWILTGLFKVWILRVSGSLDLRVLRIFGFRIFKVLDLVSVDLRILVSDFDTGFGHLVFVDLVILVCWYKDVKGVTEKENFSTKSIFCPTKEINARRTVLQSFNNRQPSAEKMLETVIWGGRGRAYKMLRRVARSSLWPFPMGI